MALNLSFLNNDAVVIILALLVALYSSMVRVELPLYLKNLFQNNIFRVIFLSLLLIFTFDKAPHVAISIALIFVITLAFLNRQERIQNFQAVLYYNYNDNNNDNDSNNSNNSNDSNSNNSNNSDHKNNSNSDSSNNNDKTQKQ